MKTLKERLEHLLRATGKSQADIARACKIKQPSVHAWFSGETKVLRGNNAVATARLLGVHTDWLLEGKGPKWADPEMAGRAGELAQYVASGGLLNVTARDKDVDPLDEALQVIGMAVAHSMPSELREDIADAFKKLVRRSGKVHEQNEVLRLLRAVGKLSATGT